MNDNQINIANRFQLFENNFETFKILSDNSFDIINILDKDGKILFESIATERILGYKAGERIGQVAFSFVHPDDFQHVATEFQDLILNPQMHKIIEFRFKHINGSWKWLETSGQNFLHNPNIKGIILNSRDISDRVQREQELKEMEERWKFALDGAEDGVWDWNMKTNEVYFSKHWKWQLGYNDDDIENNLSEWEKRVHPADLKKCYEAIQLHIENKTPFYSNIHRLLCKNGNYKWILDRGKIMKRDENNNPLRMIGTHADMTERIIMENQLMQINADKDRFIKILAHDLKNPFNSLLGFSDLLIKNLHKYDIQKIEKQIKLINKVSHQTYGLLEQILLWAKSQSGKLTLELQKIEFLIEINDIIKTLENQAAEKCIKIDTFETEKIILTADLIMFKTVMRNLISNAIKFTHLNGQINIYAEKNRTNTIITVSDNGIGIDKNIIPKLWEFSDNYSTAGTNNEKGTGFGLTLCKELIEKQGGQIWVESEVGKGSDFKFTLPLNNN